jgi:hypothetical protein
MSNTKRKINEFKVLIQHIDFNKIDNIFINANNKKI